jgi:hypothetical protein
MTDLATGIAIVEKVLGKGKVFLIPLVLVAIATAIMLSSHILANTKDITFMMLFKILALGAILALLTTVFVPAVFILGRMNLKDLIQGSLAIVVIAAAIMVSSHILALGNYSKFPDFKWAAGVGLSLVAFAASAAALGIIAMTGVGAVAILAGAGMTLVVAATIVAASHILAKGNYKKGPSLDWALGTGMLMTGFGLSMLVLGTAIVASLGLGWVAMEIGSKAVTMIARTIVKSSYILAKGNYVKGPTKEWAEGVGTAIGAFSPVYKMLMANGVLKLFGGGGVGPKDFVSAIKTISYGIIDSAKIFAKNKATFDGGYPSKKWGQGVGSALSAFAPIFRALSKDVGLFTSGASVVSNMTKAIRYISRALVHSAVEFSRVDSDVWKSYPTKRWSYNVKMALKSFSGIYKNLASNQIKPSSLGLVSIYASHLSKTASILGKNKKYFDTYIDPNFVKNMSKNIIDYQDLVNNMSNYKTSTFASYLGLDPVQRIANGMVKIASAYTKLSKAISLFSKSINSLDANKVKLFNSVQGNISPYAIKYNKSKYSSASPGLNSKKTNLSVLNAVSGVSYDNKSKKNTSSPYKDSKGETQLQKLDKVIYWLKKLNNEANGINEFLHNPSGSNNDIGAKGDQ